MVALISWRVQTSIEVGCVNLLLLKLIITLKERGGHTHTDKKKHETVKDKKRNHKMGKEYKNLG